LPDGSRETAAKSDGGVPGKPGAQTAAKEIPEEPLAIPHPSIRLHGQTFNYRATAGYLPLRDDSGKMTAQIYFVAYTKKD
jgi:carboxypeptidase C (cathepsin A)